MVPKGPGGVHFCLMSMCLMQRQAMNEQGSNLWDTIPTGLPSPGDGVVHDVISHQEECLQLQGTQSLVSCRAQAEKGYRALSCTTLVMQCTGMQQQTRSPLRLCVRALHGYGQKLLVACKPARGRQFKKQAHPLNAPAQNIGFKQLLTVCLQEAAHDAMSPFTCQS